MPKIDHMQLVSALMPAVLQAGAIEMRYYREGCAVETKADQSVVTVADREAENVLVAAIEAAAPEIPVIAEEAVSAGRVPVIGDCFFLVDPLDGTREFVDKRGEFTVNVAVIQNGEPVFGIVYGPATEELYVTTGHDIAAMTRIAATATSVAVADLTAIRTRAPDPAGLVAMASRSHSNPETETFLARFRVAARTSVGSSLKFCAIARGAADLYPRLSATMEWDTAAGHAILRAAGGSVTTLDGAPLRYGNVANGLRNPHFVAWGTSTPIAPIV